MNNEPSVTDPSQGQNITFLLMCSWISKLINPETVYVKKCMMREKGPDIVQQGNHFTELEGVACMANLSLLFKKVFWKNKDPKIL